MKRCMAQQQNKKWSFKVRITPRANRLENNWYDSVPFKQNTR